MYTFDEYTLSLEDLLSLAYDTPDIELSENLIKKIDSAYKFFISKRDYIEELLKDKKSYEFNFEDNYLYISEEETKSIIITFAYFLSLGHSGVKKEVIEEIISLIKTKIQIPEYSLSLNIKYPTPYHFIISQIKNADEIERNLILESKGYITGVSAILWKDLETARKLYTIIYTLLYKILTGTYPYIDPWILALKPHISPIKMGENINHISEQKSCQSNPEQPLTDLLYDLMELYNQTNILKERINTEINSIDFPILLIPEEEKILFNSNISTSMLIIKNLTYTTDTLYFFSQKLLSKFLSLENTSIPLYGLFSELSVNYKGKRDTLICIRNLLKTVKKIIFAELFIEYNTLKNMDTPETNVEKILKDFMETINQPLTSFQEISKKIDELLYQIETEIGELY
ncbi:MAG TPA: hypothetical protein PKW23_04970 [Dictyoglomaceae bacterium]|nr:hypothetical protein [Dictyoglomaceae bacterium]HOL39508.1 hypothetical protein [Dictyoglomaceae bacterium]HPP16113.1 hypothetical protein [Dictyoglomaceae bacterium]